MISAAPVTQNNTYGILFSRIFLQIYNFDITLEFEYSEAWRSLLQHICPTDISVMSLWIYMSHMTHSSPFCARYKCDNLNPAKFHIGGKILTEDQSCTYHKCDRRIWRTSGIRLKEERKVPGNNTPLFLFAHY
jgi:hypothetical protein